MNKKMKAQKRASQKRYSARLNKKRSELEAVVEALKNEDITDEEVVELEELKSNIEDDIMLIEDVIADIEELVGEVDSLSNAEVAEVVDAAVTDVVEDENSESRAELPDDLEEELAESDLTNEDTIEDEEDVAVEQNRGKRSYNLSKTRAKNSNNTKQRTEFMNAVSGKRGALESYKEGYSTRTAGSMNTTNNEVLIPQTILDLVFTGLHEYGNILNKLNIKDYKGKAIVPVSDFAQIKAVIRKEGDASVSTEVVTDELIFGYFALEAMIEQTDIANAVGLSDFESQFADIIIEAVISKMEQLILKGTGTGEPLGVLNTAGVKKYNVELSYEGIMSNILPKIKTGYKGGFFIGTTAAFYKVKGLVDLNGQPVAGVTMGSDNAFINGFYGHDFIVADHVDLGDDELVYVVGSKVVINNNLRPTVETWYEERNNKRPTRVKTYFDSKLVDPDAAIAFTLVEKTQP